MKTTSTYKILYLLNLLLEKKCSKNDIIAEFEKNNIKITKTLINYYIDKIKKNGFDIKVEVSSNMENYYYFDKKNASLYLKDEELDLLDEIKNILFSKKDYDKIQKTIRLFYKLAKFIDDKDKRLQFINFKYFSTLNWNLVSQLERHCLENNVITVDYILPKGQNDYITIYADSIKMSKWNDRIYLYGYVDKVKQFYSLPIDRIYMVKKINEKNATLPIKLDELTYVVSKEIYDTLEEDKREKIVNIIDNKVKIKRMIDDEFLIVQRLMSFCPDIYYISDDKIKKILIDKLKSIEALYYAK